jgi:hypothetical protein
MNSFSPTLLLRWGFLNGVSGLCNRAAASRILPPLCVLSLPHPERAIVRVMSLKEEGTEADDNAGTEEIYIY